MSSTDDVLALKRRISRLESCLKSRQFDIGVLQADRDSLVHRNDMLRKAVQRWQSQCRNAEQILAELLQESTCR